MVALIQRKPLFVRHCGIWGITRTLADRFQFWLLQNIAGGSNVVLATGGRDTSPSQKNPNIKWIFSTTLSEKELSNLPIAECWQPGEEIKLVTVSRLSPSKNTESIILAMQLLQTQNPQISLSIIGDGEVRIKLEELTQKLNLSGKVVFWGNLPHDQVMDMLTRSHIFVFPTLSEGFPKAVIEAMACGLPIIASNVSVLPRLVQGCGIILKILTQKP